MFRRRKFLFLGLAVVFVVIVGVAVYPAIRWHGVHPVADTNLERGRWMNPFSPGPWRNLPFQVDPAEEADVRVCVELAQKCFYFHNDVPEFVSEEVRNKLEEVLARRPGFFYAEHLLSVWYNFAGDQEQCRLYQKRSLEHAPVVLVQPFRFPDGQPLTGTDIPRYEIECNRVHGGSLDPSLRLLFVHLRTDASGEIRLPVYHTVYRRTMVTHPIGYDCEFPQLGWFKAVSKTALIPAAIVRKLNIE